MMNTLRLADSQIISTKEEISRFLSHEIIREFSDRLIDTADKEQFYKILTDELHMYLKLHWAPEDLMKQNLIYGNFFATRGNTSHDKVYQPLTDFDKLTNHMETIVMSQNNRQNMAPFIFFQQAVDHIVRISRVMLKFKGHMLLLGAEGSGKYSNVKLATIVNGYSLNRLNQTNDYSLQSFRNDMKKLIEDQLIHKKPTVLYITDADDDLGGPNCQFMDDLCCLLTNGEIPNLYETDELESVLSQIIGSGNTDVGDGKDDKKKNYNALIEITNQYLHVIICLNPTNIQCREMLRNYPELINCTSIDWYCEKWSADSYKQIAYQRCRDIALNLPAVFNNGDSQIITQLAEKTLLIYEIAGEIGDKFRDETRRQYWLSSGDFVEFLNNLSDLLNKNYKINFNSKERLTTGLNQLINTNILIAQMKEELIELGPKIKEKSMETEQLLSKLQEDRSAVSEVEQIVRKEEEIMQKEMEIVEKYSKKCEQELESVQPILTAAIEALKNLDKKDISELRVYLHPPTGVKLVMSAVCILFNQPANWSNSRLLLGDPHFMQSLLDYEKDQVTPKMYRDIQAYTSEPEFNPEVIRKISLASMSLCQWVLALEHYYSVNHMLKPKKKKVIEANAALEQSKKKLEWKQAQLKKVTNHLTKLDDRYQNSVQEFEELKERQNLTNERLDRAAALIEALKSEKDRWEEGIVECEDKFQYLIGNNLLSAAYVSFTGPWTNLYREEAKHRWIECLGSDEEKEEDKMNFSVDPIYRFTEAEFTKYEILNWHNDGLPRDSSMAENVAIIKLTSKWGLIIDPQLQGKSFLLNSQPTKSGLKVISCRQKDYVSSLERAIRVGDSVLLEDIESRIDPVLGPLIRKEIFFKNQIPMIKLGDSEVEYSSEFRLYLMTSHSNPTLQSSVGRLVSIINFSVNMSGVQEQLLSIVVSLERPEIEKERDELLRSYATDLARIQELEDRTLGLIQGSTEKLVNDSELSQNLETSKLTAHDIKDRLIRSEETEKELEKAREFYLPLAIRGSLVYFVVADLGTSVNKMYQFSLSWLKDVFVECVKEVQMKARSDAKEPDVKLKEMTKILTYKAYEIVSEGIFSSHKLMFSFSLCTTIMRNLASFVPRTEEDAKERSAKMISQEMWSTFISLHTASSLVFAENIEIRSTNNNTLLTKPHHSDWLSQEVWNKCKFIESRLPQKFENLCADMVEHYDDWTKWRRQLKPWCLSKVSEHSRFNLDQLSIFDKFVIVTIMMPNNIIECTNWYVEQVFGHEYTRYFETNLRKIFTDTQSKVPIVFILGPNSDPVSSVQRLAMEIRGNQSHLDIISMGRGQATKAEALVQKTSIHKGRWIYLQNCDLMISWLPNLKKIIENLQITKQSNDPNFKLIFSTHPHKDFPLSILQMSRKIAIERPIGIKDQVLKSFSKDGTGSVTETYFNEQSMTMRKMIFSLCLFNAVLLERCQFGALGFNLLYDFNNADLEISILQLPIFISKESDSNSVDWKALREILGSINYGGRVTDLLDIRCLQHMLILYQNDEVLGPSSYSKNITTFESVIEFMESPQYTSIPSGTLLGMSEIAGSVRLEKQGREFLLDLVLQQTRHIDESGSNTDAFKSQQEIVSMLTNKIHVSINDTMITVYGKDLGLQNDPNHPIILSIFQAMKDDLERKEIDPENYQQYFDLSFHKLLEKEISSYDRLLERIHNDLRNLTGYFKSEKSLDEHLEDVLNLLVLNIVPDSWNMIGSFKSLADWSHFLSMKVEFVSYWSYTMLTRYHKYIEEWTKVSTNSEIKHSVEIPSKILSCFWLPGFMSPNSFFSAVIQSQARIKGTSIDSISVQTRVLTHQEYEGLPELGIFTQQDLYDVGEPFQWESIISNFKPIKSENGSEIYVFGLYLDNAEWDVNQSHLIPNKSRRFCKLPILQLIPKSDDSIEINMNSLKSNNIYKCPLYRTPERNGFVSGSGELQELVTFLSLTTNGVEEENFWILRGTAALLECDIE